MGAIFGPAGNSNSFKEKYKSLEQVPDYLLSFGLGAFEYQCGRGVKINQQKAAAFGSQCREAGIRLSVHAPYYISLSSVEEEKRDNSIRYILQSLEAARTMGATRIIAHSGSCGKITREHALELALDTIRRAVQAADEAGFGDIAICPETMGKVNQLGTLDEVLALCSVDERLIPCIDFGHLNARTFGGIATQQDYADILDAIENRLGFDRLKLFHSHFSKIQYTLKGGEKLHLTFEDQEYGPEFEPLAELIAKKNLSPTFICESAGTQAEDAAEMKRMYERYQKEKEL